MNVLYVTSWDGYGTQFNGYSLSSGLRQNGIQANMLVDRRQFQEPEIAVLGGALKRTIDRGLYRIEDLLSLQRVLPLSFSDLFRSPWYRQADIVHFQLVHGSRFLNLSTVPRVARERKLVWTVHDPWLLTGHCIYFFDCTRWETGCGRCPYLNTPFPIRRDTTAWHWKRKQQMFHRTPAHLVVASEWMRNLVERSPLTAHLDCTLIPFGVDTAVFHPAGREASRARFGIPPDAYVLACRWAPKNAYKGTHFIEKALGRLSVDRPVFVLTFDSDSGSTPLKSRFSFIDLGWVYDPETVADAMRAADLFLMPSTAEAFGLMAIEAMACGTPVIVFEGTALPSVVHAPLGGRAVAPDSEALSAAIEDLLAHPEQRRAIAQEGLQIVEREYTFDQYVSRHIDLYRSLLDGAEGARTPA